MVTSSENVNQTILTGNDIYLGAETPRFCQVSAPKFIVLWEFLQVCEALKRFKVRKKTVLSTATGCNNHFRLKFGYQKKLLYLCAAKDEV